MNHFRHKVNAQLNPSSGKKWIGGWVYRDQCLTGNEDFSNLLGFSTGQPISIKSIIKRIEKWCRPVFKDALRKCVKDGSSFEINIQVRGASGKIRWVRLTAYKSPNTQAELELLGTVKLLNQDLGEISPYKLLQAMNEALSIPIDMENLADAVQRQVEIITQTGWFSHSSKCLVYILENNGFECIASKGVEPSELPQDIVHQVYDQSANVVPNRQFRLDTEQMRFDQPVCYDAAVVGHLVMFLEPGIELDPLFVEGANAFCQVVSQSIARFQALEHLRISQSQIISCERLAALGEMSGGVAHEINNPLAIIDGYSKHIRSTIFENGGTVNLDEISDLFDIVEKTVERIVKIAEGLRRISRDGSADAVEPTSIKEILEDTLVLCQQKFKNQGIKIETEDYREDAMITCRAIELSQVLVNLLNNSFDAIAKNKERWVRIKIQEQDEVTIISVIDSGPGISQEIREQIMQPFFTTKEVGSGTGLGLSISREILEKMGGELQIDTTHKNTKFDIIVPSGEGHEDATQKAS